MLTHDAQYLKMQLKSKRCLCVDETLLYTHPMSLSEERKSLEAGLDRPFPLGTMIHLPPLDPLDQTSDPLLTADFVDPLLHIPKGFQLFG